MKLCGYIALALAVTAVSCLRAGREYRYRYEAQALTAMPDTSHEFTGFTIKSDVMLQIGADMTVRMKMGKTRLFYTNDILDHAPKRKPIDTPDALRELPAQLTALLLNQLTKPVEFTIGADGLIGPIKVDDSEPPWSVNVKRGFINILQITAEPDVESQTAESAAATHNTAIISYRNTTENTIFGRCGVSYTYKSEPFSGSGSATTAQVLNVNKVIDMTSCYYDTNDYQSVWRTFKCLGCRGFKDLIQSTNEIQYNIIGDFDRFEIDEAIVNGRHIFAPYKNEMSSVVTFVHQKVKLSESQPIVRLIVAPANPQSTDLRMVTNENEPSLLMRTPMQAQLNFEKIHEILEKIVTAEANENDDLPYLLVRLVQIVQRAELDDLRTISSRYFATTNDKKLLKIRSVLIDVLPITGNKPALTFLIDIVRRNYAEGERLVQILAKLPLSLKPTTEIVDTVKSLCQQENIVRNREAKRTCILAYSTILNKLLGDNNQEKQNAIELKYWPELEALWANARKEMDQVLALKAIGNAGFTKTFGLLARIVTDASKTKIIRYQAALSMKSLSVKRPAEVRAKLIPLLMKSQEITEIRAVSFLMLMETMPNTETLGMIVTKLREEKNLHFASYVYSFLKSVSTSTMPALTRMSKKISAILRHIPPIKPGIQYPKHAHLPLFIEGLNFGTAVDLCTITTRESFVPKAARLAVHSHIFGNDFNVAEVGYYMEGLHTILEKLFGPHGSYYTGKSIFDIFKTRAGRRAERHHDRRVHSNPTDDIEPQITPRESVQPKGFAYIKVFDRTTRMFAWETETFAQYLQNKKISIVDIVDSLRQEMALDWQKTIPLEHGYLRVPSAMGLPVRLDLIAIAHLHVKDGIVKEAVSSSETDTEPSTDVKVKLTMAPKLAVGIDANQGVELAMMKFTVNVRGHFVTQMPLKVAMKYDRTKRHLEFRTPVLSQEEKLMSFKLEPVIRATFHDPAKPIVAPKIDEKPIVVLNCDIKTLNLPEMEYVRERLGLRTAVHHTYARGKIGQPILYAPFFGPLSTQVIVKPAITKPSFVAMAIDVSGMGPSLADLINVAGVEPGARIVSAGGTIDDAASHILRRRSIARTLSVWPQVSDDEAIAPEQTSLTGYHVADLPDLVPIDNPQKWQLTFKVQAFKNDSPQTVATTALVLKVKNDAEKNNYNIQAQLVDIPQQSGLNSAYKICVNGYIKMAAPVSMAYTPPKAPRKIDAKVHFMHGPECAETNVAAKLIVNAEMSEEQKSFQSSPAYEQFPAFIQCQKDVATGLKYSSECVQISDYFNELYKYYLDLTFNKKKIPAAVSAYAAAALSWIRGYLGASTQDAVMTSPVGAIENDAVFIFFDLKPAMAFVPYTSERSAPAARAGHVTSRAADVTVESPWFWNRWLDSNGDEYTLVNVSIVSTAQNVFGGIRVPWPIMPMNIESGMMRNYLHLMTDGKLPAWCKVDDERVHTFDKVFMDAAMPAGCEVVVAKDCSGENLFTVTLTKQTTERSRLKYLKVKTEGHEFRLEPVNSIYHLFVDDQPMELDELRPIVYKKDPGDPQSPITATVLKKADGDWVIAAPLSLVKVRFNGLETKIDASPFYYSKTCGLCGNFNGDVTDELTAPSGAQLATVADVVRSYLVPSATCQAAERRYLDDSATENTATEVVCAVQVKNYVYRVEQRYRTCITVKPRTYCPRPGCRPVAERHDLFDVFCLRNDDVELAAIMRRIAAGAVTFTDKTVAAQRNLPTETECTAA